MGQPGYGQIGRKLKRIGCNTTYDTASTGSNINNDLIECVLKTLVKNK